MMVERWIAWRVGLCATFVIASGGCHDACQQIAAQLRDCCARGPAELRARCEAEAKKLEDRGNSGACQSAADRGSFEGCQ
jgi:hypothetical protein